MTRGSREAEGPRAGEEGGGGPWGYRGPMVGWRGFPLLARRARALAVPHDRRRRWLSTRARRRQVSHPRRHVQRLDVIEPRLGWRWRHRDPVQARTGGIL